MQIHVDAAHQIVLARVDRYPVLGDIHALLQAARVYHRKAVLHKVGRLVRDVKIKILAAGFERLACDRVGNHVARRQLSALVIVKGKALAVTVQQHRALAAHGFADEKALAVLVRRKGGGMELHARQVADLGAQHVGKGNAVAGGDRGVGGVLIDPADAAGRQNAVAAAEIQRLAVVQDAQIKAVQRFVHGIEQRVFENIDVGQLLDRFDQRIHDRLAGGVLVVDDAVAAVTGFERFFHGAVGVEVVVHAQLLGFEHIGRTLLDELFHGGKGVFVFAGDQRVADVQLIRVVNGVEHTGDATLCQRAVRQRQLSLGHQENADVPRKADGGIQACRTGSDNNDVIFFIHFCPSNSIYKWE